MDFRLELVQVPVSDVDRAKAFSDMDAAYAELADRGVELSDIQELGRPGRPGFRFAYFTDPDGNGWAVQEIKGPQPRSD